MSLFQAFVRDPDGYYIEFCSCESLNSYLEDRMANNQSIESIAKQDDGNLNFSFVAKARMKLKEAGNDAKARMKLKEAGNKAKTEILKKFTEKDNQVKYI